MSGSGSGSRADRSYRAVSEGQRILLISVGRRVDERTALAVEAYRRRLPAGWQWDWVQLSEASAGSLPVRDVMAREGRRILERAEGRLVVALAEQGVEDDSITWAGRFQRFLEQGRPLALVIGGAHGLSPEVLQRADHVWSLSRLTFPHEMVPLLVAEQIYRAHSILHSHPYHKA